MSSMNEAIRCLTVHHQYVFDNDPDVDWSEYERMLNWMPYKAINHDSPQRVLREMLRPEG
ncbi:MAG: hypothetical protein K9N23_22710, partial [Akkermansiaceae bacterium]|nr:hypothetical protein [Akkermansiaceae bacterium]MCF7734513.1 hypothetical protein [Akkermansiaceae bacterium]